MGPPTVVCSICNEKVLKARTRHIGNGQRACLTHPGVEEKATVAQAAIAQEITESRKPKRFPRREPEPMPPLLPSCCICGQAGIREDEFYIKMAIASKQLELQGKLSLLDPAATRQQMNLPPEVKTVIRVYTTEMLSEAQFQAVVSRCKPHLRDLLASFGFTGVCLPCAEKLQLPDPHAKIKEIDLKNLALLGTLMEPWLTEMAQRSL